MGDVLHKCSLTNVTVKIPFGAGVNGVETCQDLFQKDGGGTAQQPLWDIYKTVQAEEARGAKKNKTWKRRHTTTSK